MREPVGIDAISVYVPRLYLPIAGEWSQSRFISHKLPSAEALAQKTIKGIGIEKMAMCDAYEDAATMAAMAALRLIESYAIPISEICYLAVGTETTVDQSKSLPAYVLGMLENYFDQSLPHCGCPQFQFACAGATYALESALNIFRAQQNTGKYAIVIATDIAKYDLYSSGESTQGAGAVALLISTNPRLVVMEDRSIGLKTVNERDFFRPNWQKTAVVDGKYSTNIYLNTMEAAFKHYEQQVRKKALGTSNDTAIDSLICHVPYPRMAEYVAARFLPIILPSLAILRTNDQTQIPLSDEYRRQKEREIRSSPEFIESFTTMMSSSLIYAREVGNIYSGSLFLSLASMLEETTTSMAKKRLLFCSYGSGATAIVFSGIVAPNYQEVLSQCPTRAMLSPQRRKPISLADYEYLHELEDTKPDETGTQRLFFPRRNIQIPDREFVLEKLGTDERDFGFRYYLYKKHHS